MALLIKADQMKITVQHDPLPPGFKVSRGAIIFLLSVLHGQSKKAVLPYDCEVRVHCMCKEMPVIPVNRVVDRKIISEKMGGIWRRRRGTRGH
jgi:hypothetical protein